MKRMNSTPVNNSEPHAPDYASRIRQERSTRAWTQEMLAEESGLSVRTVQRIECGETPSQESIESLAAAFRIGPEELTGSPIQEIFSTGKRRKRSSNTAILLTILFFTLLLIPLSYWAGGIFIFSPPQNYKEFLKLILPKILFLECLLMWMQTPFLIIGLRIHSGRLFLLRPGWSSYYNLSDITGIAHCPQAGMGTLAISPMYFNYGNGLYYNRLLGFFRGQIKSAEKAVMIQMGRRKLVLAPDDPEAFIDVIRTSIAMMHPERELPPPECMEYAPMDADYSARIREERSKRGWSQRELAKHAGLSIRTVQRLEKGMQPSTGTLRLLCETFELSVTEMSATGPRTSFKAPWPPKHRPWLAAAFAITLLMMMGTAFVLVFTLDKTALYLCWAMDILFLLNLYTAVYGFNIRGGRLYVNHIGFASKYDLVKLTGMRADPKAMMGAMPLSFPLIILSPWCRSPLSGTFRAFVTNEAHCVIMEFGKKKIVVTPDDPETFLQAIRAELERLSGEKDAVQQSDDKTPVCMEAPEKPALG